MQAWNYLSRVKILNLAFSSRKLVLHDCTDLVTSLLNMYIWDFYYSYKTKVIGIYLFNFAKFPFETFTILIKRSFRKQRTDSRNCVFEIFTILLENISRT